MAGEATVSLRRRRRHPVRPGGRHSASPAQIEVDSVELMPFTAITPPVIRRSGERDHQSLRQRAAHAGPTADDTLPYQVEFHLLRQPGRRAPVQAGTPGAGPVHNPAAITCQRRGERQR